MQFRVGSEAKRKTNLNDPMMMMTKSRQFSRCQVRSGQSVKRAHSEQAAVAHACHGHRYRPPPVPLSRTGKKGGRE